MRPLADLRLPSRELSRRTLLQAGALGSALALSGCGVFGRQREGAVVFVSDGGEYQTAQREMWLEPFRAAHPDWDVLEDVPKNYAKLKAMVESDNVMWDVMTATGDYGYGDDRAVLTDLDPGRLGLDLIDPRYVHESIVGHTLFSNVLAYRTDLLDRAPESWADFFDLDRFPGRRGLRNFPAGVVLEIALTADGVAPEDLYPLDFDRAFAKLDTIRDQTVFWTSGAQSAQLIADGEVSMTQIWNGRVFNLQKEDAPIEIQWNQHFLQADALVIPRGANQEQAEALVSHILAPENNALLSSQIPYGPTNMESLDLVDRQMLPHLPTSHLDVALDIDGQWLNAHRAEVNDRWQGWVRS